MPSTLLFTPLSSQPSPAFWHRLSSLKLDELKLESPILPVQASYGAGKIYTDRTDGREVGVGGAVVLDENSLASGESSFSKSAVPIRGQLLNYNTIEDFKASDKVSLFNQLANEMWSSIATSSDSIANLSSFLLITFSDLKKYKFYYWFAFPAFVSPKPWQVDDKGLVSVEEAFTSDQLASIYTLLSQGDTSLRTAFLIKTDAAGKVALAPLKDLQSFFAQHPQDQITLGFLDTSASPTSPGWTLRNILALVGERYLSRESTQQSIRVVCWRDTELAPHKGSWRSRFGVVFRDTPETKSPERPNAVGWEKNANGKLAPRLADLGSMMDPERLAAQSTDLNLKLMRWRLLPELNLEVVRDFRVLVLGAGTLGCYFSRGIMAWGTRNITLVDSSTVSYSNPVRQPLFEFKDAVAGAPKAETAAASLKRIFPGVNAKGIKLYIPMPGHPIPEASREQTIADIKTLEKLVDEHDAIILGMDSRESRWLPTLLGKAKGKMVMNTALGFDSYVVMRHGARDVPGKTNPGLGCYFCNDVVAPGDSLKDQTLDQMCTVTRPGLAAIASATTVELLVAMIQHPDGVLAPAPPILPGGAIPEASSSKSPLGLVPHQLRGFLAQFRTLPLVGSAFKNCTACSELIIKEYEVHGVDMILKVCNDKGYMEKITGLDEMIKEAEAMAQDMERWDGDEGDGDEDDF